MPRSLRTRMLRGLRNPSLAISYLQARLRGAWVSARHWHNARVRIGRGFSVVSRLAIRGPGHVTIGDHVSADGRPHPVTLFTYSTEAELSVGSGTFLNGTRFGCARRVRVGRRCILADCRILDTNFHSIYPERRDDPRDVKVLPVEIGDDCWIGAGAFILPGTRIREGSTVAAGAVVMGRFPARSVIAGNPATVIMTVGVASS